MSLVEVFGIQDNRNADVFVELSPLVFSLAERYHLSVKDFVDTEINEQTLSVGAGALAACGVTAKQMLSAIMERSDLEVHEVARPHFNRVTMGLLGDIEMIDSILIAAGLRVKAETEQADDTDWIKEGF